ncbi:RnfABCDGE type electron transport complex subunit G [Geoalkalibacter halelectricus]|uniref:Ion-translocating oxidoreductase complex subunit G n=1 Tax=Geoalkalibacter halelectricus TaxID=2847045 RepID=A0ABY5ZFQ0_9BACT|nr:RnfABCDGE type electron transport complex subunit G [Geoalkalibacter halelectricus]MDO3378152.1 RnfABCDGE type electron transport complex subunit G [Geoalkalibacter halelectricus]UWZ77998.1 RnfABCDGE type electron transport complex subunit G [Geoalkalibacter halelectricus]
MKELFRLALVLTLITAGAGLVLSMAEQLTREPIAEQRRQETLRALRTVLPQFDNQPDQDSLTLEVGYDRRGNPLERTVYRGRFEGEFSGAAFVMIAPDGYSGNIEVMVGITPAGAVSGIAILHHAETPGLGDKIEDDWFRGQFTGQTRDSVRWAVKKDGGDFDQLTGATISARAVVGAVLQGVEFFRAQRDVILAPADRQEGGA